jgi:hypothetical protein
MDGAQQDKRSRHWSLENLWSQENDMRRVSSTNFRVLGIVLDGSIYPQCPTMPKAKIHSVEVKGAEELVKCDVTVTSHLTAFLAGNDFDGSYSPCT